MGGTENAIFGAVKGISDLSHSKKNAKRKIRNLEYAQMYNMKNKQNILEKQLAERRARLSSMGIAASESEKALQNNMISETYNDIYNDNFETNTQLSKIKNDYSHELRNQLLDIGSGSASAMSGKDD